jgi:hypothetical protein
MLCPPALRFPFAWLAINESRRYPALRPNRSDRLLSRWPFDLFSFDMLRNTPLNAICDLFNRGNIALHLGGSYAQCGMKMYVSRGIGTSFLPIRFRCPPELSIITVGF